jgi:hypothetical protein
MDKIHKLSDSDKKETVIQDITLLLSYEVLKYVALSFETNQQAPITRQIQLCSRIHFVRSVL